MVQRVINPREIADLLSRCGLSPESIDPDYLNLYVLTNAAGVFVSRASGNGVYKTSIYSFKKHSGGELRRLINDGVRWMFLNTDAIMLRGPVKRSNLPIIVMVGQTSGAYRMRETEDDCVLGATIASWAKAVGVESAVSMLRQSGRDQKADRLMRAWSEASGDVIG